MIKFRSKFLESDAVDEAINHLEEKNVDFNLISKKDADKVSKVNSKSMVLMSFIKQIKVLIRLQ